MDSFPKQKFALKLVEVSIVITLAFSSFYIKAESLPSCKTIRSCFQERLDSLVFKDNAQDIEVITLIKEISDYPEDPEGWKYNSLGLLYLIKKDDTRIAEQNFIKSLSAGNNAAAQNLAELYFYEDNYELSIKYLNKVQETNPKLGSKKHLNWARLFAQITYLTAKDESEISQSIKLFNSILNDDESGVSHYFIGHYYLQGNNIEKALLYLTEAVKRENVDAIMLLADTYSGESVPTVVDLNQAEKLYLMASSFGNARAHYNLVPIYQTQKNVSKMKYHLKKSVELGYQPAIDILRLLNK